MLFWPGKKGARRILLMFPKLKKNKKQERERERQRDRETERKIDYNHKKYKVMKAENF